MGRWTVAACAAVWAAASVGAMAQESGDKWRYTLFNPVPKDQMREFSTDRPDQTESPFTVDAGHFQLEADFASYTYDRRIPGSPGVKTHDLVVGDTNLKLGLLNNLDLQLVVTPFEWQREEDGAAREEAGVGDSLVRLKLNLWGNDGGETALGLMGFVKVPTNQSSFDNHYVEGGLIVPFNWKIREGLELGAETEFEAAHDQSGAGYHLEWANSVVVHQDLVPEKLNVYVELFSVVSTEEHAGPIVTVDFGLVYQAAEDVQLDVGVNAGITKPAADWNFFSGISFRI